MRKLPAFIPEIWSVEDLPVLNKRFAGAEKWANRLMLPFLWLLVVLNAGAAAMNIAVGSYLVAFFNVFVCVSVLGGTVLIFKTRRKIRESNRKAAEAVHRLGALAGPPIPAGAGAKLSFAKLAASNYPIQAGPSPLASIGRLITPPSGVFGETLVGPTVDVGHVDKIVRGWRTFSVCVGYEGQTFLMGMYDQAWRTAQLDAKCVISPEDTHPAPEWHCSCGIYLHTHDVRSKLPVINTPQPGGSTPVYVVAACVAWGKIIDCGRDFTNGLAEDLELVLGYRVEHCRIEKLYVTTEETAEMLGHFNVPIEVLYEETQNAMAGDRGGGSPVAGQL